MSAFLIAYDIAHPRRLRKVARILDGVAVRVQFSVFLFRGDPVAAAGLIDRLREVIRPDEDVIQAWPVPTGLSPEVFAAGLVRPATPAGVVVARSATRFIPPPKVNDSPPAETS